MPDFVCDVCDRRLQTARGLAIHRGRMGCGHRPSVIPQERQSATPEIAFPDRDDVKTVLVNLRCHTRILRRIPKGSRQAVAEALTKVIREAIDKNSVDNWTHLLCFAFRVLHVQRNTKGKKGNLAAAVKANLRVALAVASPEVVQARRIGKPKKPEDLLRKAIGKKLEEGDISGAVRILASEDAIAEPSEETLELLQQKHPRSPDDALYPDEPEARELQPFTQAEVRDGIKTFSNGSAGGIDGFRPQHLKDLLSLQNETSEQFLNALTDLVNHLMQGQLPDPIRKILYGATLTPLLKKDGGIRPIAVGSTFRRLAAKMVSRRVMVEMGEILRPMQLGYGTKGGAEVAVHAARSFLSRKTDEVKVLLKLDFKNAFNTIRRDELLWAASGSLREYFPFIQQLYRHPTTLLCGESVIKSESGVQQGDPLGPLLFCLVIDKLTRLMTSELNLWYLDDGTLGGSPATVLKDLQTVIDGAAEAGLELNLGKCELFISGGDLEEQQHILADFHELSDSFVLLTADELTLLGAPLLRDAIPARLQKATIQAETMTSRLDCLPSHQALFLLKNCLSLPKLLYVLRCSEAWRFGPLLNIFDEVIRRAAQKVTNVDMSGQIWEQAVLPVASGGLGIRRARDIALSAYISSVLSVENILKKVHPEAKVPHLIREAVDRWMELSGQDMVPMDSHSQRAWDQVIVTKNCRTLMKEADDKTQARMLASSTKESGSWLRALPIATVGNLLNDDALRIAVALRLGAPICEPHHCVCGELVDALGQHGLCCKKSRGRWSRHSALNEALRRALGSAQIPSRLEPSGLHYEKRTRPDGLTQYPWKNGRCMAWDVTVVDTLAQSYLSRTTLRAGAAADMAAERKIAKYQHLGDRYIFFPVAFETLGSWGDSAKEVIAEIGRRIKEHTGDQRSSDYLRQKLSLEIQRGNAESVLGTVEDPRTLDALFFVLGNRNF